MHRINEQLAPLATPIDDLTPDPDNARDHSSDNLAAIKASLKEFGQQKPIVVDAHGTIVAGNGTWQAAKELGWTEIAAVEYDGEGDQDGFALADNRSAELARWNHPVLSGKLRNLSEQGFDIERLGWKDYELKPLLQATWSPPAISGESFEASESQQLSPLKLTADQREVVDRAITKVREEVGDPDVKEGRAVELICADFLAK